MFKRHINEAVDQVRDIAICFSARSNPAAEEKEIGIGYYKDKKKGIFFPFDSVGFIKSDYRQHPGSVQYVFYYLFLDQLIERYKNECSKLDISIDQAKIEVDICNDFRAAYLTMEEGVPEEKLKCPRIYHLDFLDSKDIFRSSLLPENLEPYRKTLRQFTNLNLEPVRKIFEHDLACALVGMK